MAAVTRFSLAWCVFYGVQVPCTRMEALLSHGISIGQHESSTRRGHPTSQCRLHFLPFQLVRAYSFHRDWTSRRTRTTGISLVASLASCVARSWSSTPGLQVPLARTRHSMLPSAGPNAWADSERTCISGLNPIHGLGGQPSPFVLATFLCTLQRNCYQRRCNTRYRTSG